MIADKTMDAGLEKKTRWSENSVYLPIIVANASPIKREISKCHKRRVATPAEVLAAARVRYASITDILTTRSQI